MSSDKSLLLVFDLRKKEEDKALEMWTEAKNAVASFEQQIEQLKQFEKIYQNEMAGKSRNGMDMSMYFTYQQFLEKLENIKLRQEAGLVQLKEQEGRARSNYLEKQKQRKIIESLLEKHKRQRLLAEAKAEQKLTDDIVSSKQARILMENSGN
ncbi:MAG: flagellar export protein FliJ [Succinivibrio sp.]